MSKIGIIGFGNMGQAVYRILDAEGAYVFVADPHQEKLQILPVGHGTTDTLAMLHNVDTVILAVKPQSFSSLMSQVRDALKNKKLLSIMTGISCQRIKKETGGRGIVRAMPNLPLQVGKGLTAWYSDSKDCEWALGILRAMGEELRVQREELMDAVTAISGSGPAYFFYLCELLAAKAVAYGFSEEEAQKLAKATLVGSGALMDSSDKSPTEWRQAITSKGGTTQAALQYLAENSFEQVFSHALDKAKERAEELSR